MGTKILPYVVCFLCGKKAATGQSLNYRWDFIINNVSVSLLRSWWSQKNVQLQDGTTHSGQTFPHQSLNKQMPYRLAYLTYRQANLTGIFSHLWFPPPKFVLVCVKLTRTTWHRKEGQKYLTSVTRSELALIAAHSEGFPAGLRAALTCGVRCWHSCAEWRGGT